jgi:hypothetical protein
MLVSVFANAARYGALFLAAASIFSRPSCHDCDADDSCGCGGSHSQSSPPPPLPEPSPQRLDLYDVRCADEVRTTDGVAPGGACTSASECRPSFCPGEMFTKDWYAFACEGSVCVASACEQTKERAFVVCLNTDWLLDAGATRGAPADGSRADR